jgi:hypothetical protein
VTCTLRSLWFGGAVPAACTCSSVRCAFLPLGFTDFVTELYRPRGAPGFRFAELAAFWAYRGRGVAFLPLYSTFRHPPATLCAIERVAQWFSYLLMIGILASL